MNNYYFECACYSKEHLLRFAFDRDDPEMYVSIYLGTGNIFKRIWYAIKYIFGHKSIYGAFGEWSLSENDINKMESMLKNFKEAVSENS